MRKECHLVEELTQMYNKEIFKPYLNLFQNEKIKQFANYLLDEVPDYFWTTAASSTGKYHPSYSLGNGGLVRHTLSALYYAKEMLNLEMYKDLLDYKDEIYFAIMFHDCQKLGNSKYTVHEHPDLAADFIVKHWEENNTGVPKVSIDLICNMVKSHMGQWNANKYSKIVLLKPNTQLEKFVHLCDYLASRKGDEECLRYLQQ